MPRGAGLYDEGLVLTGAMRVGAGELPHRDFFANYGPGQFYVLAFLFKLFGPSVLVERVWDAAIKVCIAVLSFAAVRRWCGYAGAFASYAFCLIWLATIGFPGYPLFPALLLCQAALLLIDSPLGAEGYPAHMFASGACAGVATLFRYDVGAATCYPCSHAGCLAMPPDARQKAHKARLSLVLARSSRRPRADRRRLPGPRWLHASRF